MENIYVLTYDCLNWKHEMFPSCKIIETLILIETPGTFVCYLDEPTANKDYRLTWYYITANSGLFWNMGQKHFRFSLVWSK